ncbi:MAG: DUF1844 domain-containing protein [Calditrichaeota bacterium]|nr:DUF1844 domain-containing protein [Calditrichota bacterium]
MANQISAEEKNRVLFMHLVTMFETAAWQHMGKIQNPLTGKIEKDLEQARFSIDVLDMLLARTQGNLSDEERRYLEDRIRNLKLNFVDEVEKERKQKEAEQKRAGEEGKKQPTSEEKAEQSAESQQAETAEGKESGKEEKSEEAASAEKTESSEGNKGEAGA